MQTTVAAQNIQNQIAQLPQPEPVSIEITVDPIKKSFITREDIVTLVAMFAVKHGLDPNKRSELFATVLCEAPKNADGTYDPAGQSRHITKKGTREDSWGVTQINLPSHKDITRVQAQSAEWSINWMASAFSDGKEAMWTCWRDLKRSGSI